MDAARIPKPPVTFDDFARLDLRVGRITAAIEHANADKLLVLQVDMGGESRQICAPLKGHYRPEELVGKLVVVAVNLEARVMRGQASQGLLLTAREMRTPGLRERIVIVSPAAELPPGSAVS